MTPARDSGSTPVGSYPGDLPGAGLRVLTVTNMWPQAGGYRGVFVKELVEALRTLGVDTDVEIVAQSRGRRDYLLAAPRIARRARCGGYQLVHIHHGMVGPACRFVSPLPRVMTLYGHDVNWHWQRWITRLGWGGVAAKVYVSRRMAITAGDPAGRVIPNGVDFPLFAPTDRQQARRALGISEHTQVIMFGADPTNWVKGYDIFTDVVSTLRSRGLEVQPLILSAPGVTRREVADKFAAADLLLFTSCRGFEGSPTVVKEATAAGLPVVSTDVGDVPDILDGITPSAVVAFPRPWGRPAARQALVAQLADHTAEILAAGGRSNGRERNAWLAWDRIATATIDVYRDVLASR